MDKITELAILLKERDNIKPFDITTAKVISINPLVLKLSEKIFLSKEYNNVLYSYQILSGYKREARFKNLDSNISDLNGTIEYLDNAFKIDDEIIVIPISNGQIWYAIDKVVRI